MIELGQRSAFSNPRKSAARHYAPQDQCVAAGRCRHCGCPSWPRERSTAHPSRPARSIVRQGPAGWCVNTQLSVNVLIQTSCLLFSSWFVDQAPTDAIAPAAEAVQAVEQVPEATYQVPQPYQAPYGQVSCAWTATARRTIVLCLNVDSLSCRRIECCCRSLQTATLNPSEPLPLPVVHAGCLSAEPIPAASVLHAESQWAPLLPRSPYVCSGTCCCRIW